MKEHSNSFFMTQLGKMKLLKKEAAFFLSEKKIAVQQFDPVIYSNLATLFYLSTLLSENAPSSENAPLKPASIGIIQVSPYVPTTLDLRIYAGLEKQRVSPLQFISANAGAALSIACTQFKWQGPTLNITMPPRKDVIKKAAILAQSWLLQGSADFLFLIIDGFDTDPKADYSMGLLLKRSQDPQALKVVVTPLGIVEQCLETFGVFNE